MVEKIRIYRNNGHMLIPIEQYLEEYHSKTVPDWYNFLDDLVYKAFSIIDEDSYRVFLKSASLKYFDYKKMKDLYEWIKIDLGFFEEDILKYIAYIATFGYFEQIGNPSWYVWLNAKDINEPFKKYNDDEGFSIVDIMGLKYGTNAIKRKLLSATRVLYGSFA
ncbi:MAG: hypothetical protein LBL79_13930 [Prevotella sp.]|jgi:hypothetical protein|nr:hypothetical protein [Prevotella sp.]